MEDDEMNNEKEKILSAVRFWALAQGYEEVEKIENVDLTFKKEGLITSFVTEFDKKPLELKYHISWALQAKSDFVYVVTNDNGKRRELIKKIPDLCGILCYGNPFGLGFLYQVLKKAELAI